jgi:hypothetical protein
MNLERIYLPRMVICMIKLCDIYSLILLTSSPPSVAV